eukprot:CAMPEP_0117451426 /NCGR_PEP_ID=MMETSP0759-20121206/8999_1 /TAXON_ID=63605 /ORGANISM="Percolomonas cosmopolitus, Strain WS" /LENGTH=762 /DNA_ID=CAMNT_0005244021 /DNA_START=171 /DNA_END=2457 /DNA_ORIENTATION=+
MEHASVAQKLNARQFSDESTDAHAQWGVLVGNEMQSLKTNFVPRLSLLDKDALRRILDGGDCAQNEEFHNSHELQQIIEAIDLNIFSVTNRCADQVSEDALCEPLYAAAARSAFLNVAPRVSHDNAVQHLPANCIQVCAKSEQKPSKREQRKLQAYLKLIAQQENEAGAGSASTTKSAKSSSATTTSASYSQQQRRPKKEKSAALALLADATTKKNEKKRKRSSTNSDSNAKQKKKKTDDDHDSDYDTDSEEIMPDPELEDRVKLFSYVKQYLIDWKLDMNQPLAITPKFPAKIGKKKLLDSYLAQDRSHLSADLNDLDDNGEQNDDYAIISEEDEDAVAYDDEEEGAHNKKTKKKGSKKKKSNSGGGGGGLMGIKIPKKKKSASQLTSTPTSAVSMTPTSMQNTPVQPNNSLDFPPSAKSNMTSSPQPSETSSASTPTITSRIPKPPIVAPDADPVSHLMRWCQQHHYNVNFRTEKCPSGFRVRVLVAGLLPAVFTPHWMPSDQEAKRKACLLVIDQLWKMHIDAGTPTPSSHGQGVAYHSDPYGGTGGAPPMHETAHHRQGMSPPDKRMGGPPRGGPGGYPGEGRGGPIPAYSNAGGRGSNVAPPQGSSGPSGVYPPGPDRGGAPIFPPDRRHYSAEPSRGYSPGMYSSSAPPPPSGGAYGDRAPYPPPDQSRGMNPPHPDYPPHGRPDPRGRAPEYDSRRHMMNGPPPPYPGEPLPRRGGSPGYPDRMHGRYPSPDYSRKERDPYGRPPSSFGGGGDIE